MIMWNYTGLFVVGRIDVSFNHQRVRGDGTGQTSDLQKFP